MTRTYYDQFYWEELQATTVASRQADTQGRLAGVLYRYIQPASSVLDIGCGDGATYACLLSQIAGSYVGIDLSLFALRRTRRTGMQAVQAQMDHALPFAAHQFDAVVCLEVLEHLFDPAGLLSNVQTVLKPSGVLIVSVPNSAHIAHRVRLLGGKFVAGGHPRTADTPWCDPHIRFFTLRSLHAMLASVAFTPIATFGIETALLTSMPIISVGLARLFGQPRVRWLSRLFEPLGHGWPSLFAGHLIVVAKQR